MAFTLRDILRDKILGVYQTKPELEKAMRRLSYEDGCERYVVVEDKPKSKSTKKAKTNVEIEGD
jgi:hypothetical protein|tara:strand:+ start:394 stop:585 length:192 start_codon:yes stop_codon:yes gene_type:complete